MFLNLDKNIIERIKHESMTPKPRWHFILKEALIWFFGALSLLIGAVSVAVMIYLFNANDLMMHAQLGHSLIGYLILSLPYFWLLFLALFLWLLFYNIKNSKRGYHYSVYLIALISVLASIILGSIFYFIGMGPKIDDVLARQAPFYDRVFNPHVGMWSQVDEGRLAGLVVARPSEDHFILIDRESGEWYVTKIIEVDDNLIVVGQPIRVIGEITGDHQFKADQIFPMKPGREFFKRFQPKHMPMADNFENYLERGSGPGMGAFRDDNETMFEIGE